MHRVREVLHEVGEEARAEEDRAERHDDLPEHEPERRGRVAKADAEPPEERDEGQLIECLALLSGLVIYVQLRVRARENTLPLSSLMLGGSLYVVFIGYVLWSVLA